MTLDSYIPWFVKLLPDTSLIFIFHPAALPAQIYKNCTVVQFQQFGQAGQLKKRQGSKKCMRT